MEGERSKENTNGVTLKVLRKHIKRLVNYAEAGEWGEDSGGVEADCAGV